MGLARSHTVFNLNSCDALGQSLPCEKSIIRDGRSDPLRLCTARWPAARQLWDFLRTITLVRRESTGPGGPDLVFQHQGAWAMRAYARAATRPRGTVIAQVPPVLFAVLCHALPAV